MTSDRIETCCGSVIQHGPHNDRIYVMSLDPASVDRLIPALDDMAASADYGKIVAKIPAPCWQPFSAAGYHEEARVPGLFQGRMDGLFVAKFPAKTGTDIEADTAADRRPANTRPGAGRRGRHRISGNCRPTLCIPMDADALCRVFRQVFASYPFPVYRPDDLKRTMASGTEYYTIRIDGEMAAVAAAEIDRKNQAVEMTDFATLPQWRGLGLAGTLLRHMEGELCGRHIKTAFTIARTESGGINAIFENRGYLSAGRLIRNTHISGRIQDMNVWYKRLRRGGSLRSRD